MGSGPNAACSLPLVVSRLGPGDGPYGRGSVGAMERPGTAPQPYLGLVLEKLRGVSPGAVWVTWPRGRGSCPGKEAADF